MRRENRSDVGVVERPARAYAVRAVERRWQRRWEERACHRFDPASGAPRYFIHDAAPFTNGELHMGHVRTYVLGDVVARYQRSNGKNVLYHTGFDAFGLPIELAAFEGGRTPDAVAADAVKAMTRQLRALGISYDWSRVPVTSDPACYRWTQWLFLQMYSAGLIERRTADLPWCPDCRTTLARLQIIDGRCWRCETLIETRAMSQWFVLVSRHGEELRRGLDALVGWAPRARSMVRAIIEEGDLDWLVSRQRSWGTPIPLVTCRCCGVVPVPDAELPVCLPDDLDWTGPGALARCEAFVETSCPSCRGPAARETDTLDCFFDDLWCFMQSLVLHAQRPGFTRENLAGWLPVERAQSGLDTIYYFHLYRFLGQFLAERGLIDDPELVRRFDGCAVVLSAGRKMSKHLGNAVSPETLLRDFGADAVRVGMLWAAGPQRPLEWSDRLLVRAASMLDATHALIEGFAAIRSAPAPDGEVSRAAMALQDDGIHRLAEITRFIEEYRPNAALGVLDEWRKRIAEFLGTRLPAGRLRPHDRKLVAAALDDFVVALAPFAPHLAEECWQRLGHSGLACNAPWPVAEHAVSG